MFTLQLNILIRTFLLVSCSNTLKNLLSSVHCQGLTSVYSGMFYSVTQAPYSEKENPSSPNRTQTYDLPITSAHALPLNYRRLMGVTFLSRVHSE